MRWYHPLVLSSLLSGCSSYVDCQRDWEDVGMKVFCFQDLEQTVILAEVPNITDEIGYFICGETQCLGGNVIGVDRDEYLFTFLPFRHVELERYLHDDLEGGFYSVQAAAISDSCGLVLGSDWGFIVDETVNY